MGSVKDLRVIEPAYESQAGFGIFTFSDRYSVFDWGEMPDHISDKGAALAAMAAFNFELLIEDSIRTHYKGLVVSKNAVPFEQGAGSNQMAVELAVVYKPLKRDVSEGRIVYDYCVFHPTEGSLDNYLIGLEIIFRNGLPEGSSVFKEIAKAEKLKDPKEKEKASSGILGTLGLDSIPNPGDMLPNPVVQYTTKLEPGDRHLDPNQALVVSGLDACNFQNLKALALRVDGAITAQAAKTGFQHWDGKVEMAYRNCGLVVVDVVGTFDENRFSFGSQQVSKEVLRQWYIKNQPGFVSAIAEAKKFGKDRWQDECPIKPVHLPERLIVLVSQMYQAGANKYCEKKIFDVPDLEAVMKGLEEFR